MIKLTGYIDIPADRLEAVKAALPTHISLTRAEPGNLSFEVTESLLTPLRFDVSETFTDQAAFDFHQDRAGMSDWATVTAGIPRHYKIEEIPD